MHLFITNSHHHTSLWDGANSQTSKLHHSAVVVHPVLSNRWPSGLNPPTCWSCWSKKISLRKTGKLTPCNGLTPGNSRKPMLYLQNTFPQQGTGENKPPSLIKGFSLHYNCPTSSIAMHCVAGAKQSWWPEFSWKKGKSAIKSFEGGK